MRCHFAKRNIYFWKTVFLRKNYNNVSAFFMSFHFLSGFEYSNFKERSSKVKTLLILLNFGAETKTFKTISNLHICQIFLSYKYLLSIVTNKNIFG